MMDDTPSGRWYGTYETVNGHPQEDDEDDAYAALLGFAKCVLVTRDAHNALFPEDQINWPFLYGLKIAIERVEREEDDPDADPHHDRRDGGDRRVKQGSGPFAIKRRLGITRKIDNNTGRRSTDSNPAQERRWPNDRRTKQAITVVRIGAMERAYGLDGSNNNGRRTTDSNRKNRRARGDRRTTKDGDYRTAQNRTVGIDMKTNNDGRRKTDPNRQR